MFYTEDEIKKIKGLSEDEVAERIKAFGYNELPSSKKRGIIRIIIEICKEPMFILLIFCGLIYLVLGEPQEASMLLFFVFVIMGITIYQENKTERAVDALRDLSSPRALVIREGRQYRIAGKEVVRDDVMILREGDRVPADCVLLWGVNISADESLLTGESVPVRKMPIEKDGDISVMGKPGGDDLPFLFSGSMVVQGQGVAKVIATGIDTELGKIGKALASIVEEDTPLQKETGKLVKSIFIMAVLLSFFLIIVYGVSKGDWLNGVLSGITFAMAMLPEEFPVVLTVFLALGAWRISKKQVLTRRMAAVETLGAATVLCVDKTGTLTENRMSIAKLYKDEVFYDVIKNKNSDLPELFHELVEFGILASNKDPFDPMEKALNELGVEKLHNTEHIHDNWPFIEEYPLTRELLALSHVWKCAATGDYIVGAKGAPEAVFDLCHLGKEEISLLLEKVKTLAGEGLRVIGVAKSIYNSEKLPDKQHDFMFSFVGLVGLADPVRENVPTAIKECYQAGIRTVMITGDYPATAQNIAKQIGLKNCENCITGSEIDGMTLDALSRRIKECSIFARVVPQQKLHIVNAFKANGEIVAMTGDGVNDAPALKSAHIGVAMGERGTDVARESAAIVLLKDDFSSIAEAVKLGRRIYDNLRKAMTYIISVHIPIAGISLIPVVFGLPIILFPIHVVFLELIIDPACSIVFEGEKEEPDIMRRPPRKSDAPLFNGKMFLVSILQGVFSLAAVMGVFLLELHRGASETTARTLAFITLIISNLSLILSNRSWNTVVIKTIFVGNKAFFTVFVGAVTFLLLAIYVPFLRTEFFKFDFMHLDELLYAVFAGMISIVWFEIVKIIMHKMGKEI